MTRVRSGLVVFVAGLALACGRGADKPEASAEAGAPERSGAAAASVRVDPKLVDEGRIKIAEARMRPATGSVRFPADVVASAEGAAEAGSLLPGRVARFERREGDRVKRGEVLAYVDAPEAARAVADLLRARARVETQGRKVARLEGLLASEAATRASYDEARLELDLARADLAAARTVVTSLGLAEPAAQAAPADGTPRPLSAQLPIRSPVDGVVVERAVPLGGHVAPDTRLFRVIAEGRVLVDARLPDGSTMPQAGTAARVLPRGGAPCEATVLGALPEVDPTTRSRRVRLAPSASCAGLVGGGQADVELELGARDGGVAADVLVVPASAVVELRGAPVVFVAGLTKGTFTARPVEPGVRFGEDVAIGTSVSLGEPVVSEGAILLKGELVRAELGSE